VAGTTIDATAFGDRPAINIQGARAVVLSGINVIGKNIAPTQLSTTSFPAQRMSANGADYVSPGCADTRYSPYAGITVDAYLGTPPVGAYPNDPYGRAASFDVKIIDCSVERFVVGILTNASGQVGQSDTQVWRDNGIRDCRYAFSTGTSQSRSVQVEGNTVVEGGVHTIVANSVHGDQTGSCPYFENLSAFAFYQVHSINAGYQATTFRNCHFEAFATLGTANGNVPNAQGLTYMGCNIHRDQWTTISPALLLNAPGLPVTVIGGNMVTSFYADGQAANLINIVSNGSYIELNGVGVFNPDAPGRRFLGAGSWDMFRVLANNSLSRNGPAQFSQPQLNVRGYGYHEGRIELHPGVQQWRYGDKSYRVKYANFKWGHGITAVLNATGWTMPASMTVGASLTFTSTDTSRIQVGDYLMLDVNVPGTATAAIQQVPAAIVTAKTGLVVSARLLFSDVRPMQSSGVILPVQPVLYGTKGIQVAHTNGSRQVTVVTVSGSTATTALVTQYVQVGDYLQGGHYQSGYTRITGISGLTLTLNETATSSGTSVVGSALLVDEDSYVTPATQVTATSQLTNNSGFVSSTQSNTFSPNQFMQGSLGVGTTTLIDNAVSYRTVINAPGGTGAESGGLFITNNQSLEGNRAMLAIANFQSTDNRPGVAGVPVPKMGLSVNSWINRSVGNFQSPGSALNQFYVQPKANDLQFLNRGAMIQQINQTASSGQQVNDQAYIYVQGTGGGSAASLNDAINYWSRGQFATTNASITNLTDFRASSFIGIGTAGNSIGTRTGFLVDFDNTNTTSAWGFRQTSPTLQNQFAGRTLFGGVSDNGTDALQTTSLKADKLRLTPQSGAGVPTMTQLPNNGDRILWTNTTTNETAEYANVGGTVKKGQVFQ
jgi:hypothetical protein